jgi:hypothetical protein
VTVKVTATDSTGLASEHSFGFGVTNVNEAPDATVIRGQLALRGEACSLQTSQAFSDVDSGETLTYSLNGPSWMHIDANTGEITGTPPSAAVELQMTNGVFTPPAAGEVHIDTQVPSPYAGYHNSMGYYLADASGNPIAGGLLDKDAQDHGSSHQEINLANHPGAVSDGFFVLPNGGANSWSAGGGGDVSFVKVGNAWNVVWGGGENGTAVFSNPALNAGGLSYVTDNGTEGTLNWEDVIGLGDHDYNDLNMNAAVRYYSEEASVVKQVTPTSSMVAREPIRSMSMRRTPRSLVEPATIKPMSPAVTASRCLWTPATSNGRPAAPAPTPSMPPPRRPISRCTARRAMTP